MLLPSWAVEILESLRLTVPPLRTVTETLVVTDASETLSGFVWLKEVLQNGEFDSRAKDPFRTSFGKGFTLLFLSYSPWFPLWDR